MQPARAFSTLILLSSCAIAGRAEASDTSWCVPVLVVRYFPVSGDSIDRAVTGDWGRGLAFTRAKVDSLTRCLADSLREASRFRLYRNPSSPPSIRYAIAGTLEFLEPLPTRPKRGHRVLVADYRAVMDRIDARLWVEEKGVREIWLWAYHGGVLDLWESNMAGPFGDISNSDRDPDDLPVFSATYTVYHYNYQRGLSEAVEDHLHQIEALLTAVDGLYAALEGQHDTTVFWGRFVGWFPGGRWAQAAPGITEKRRCGWAHFTVNSERDYDWANHTMVASDIEDWTPEGTGTADTLNCERWGCASLGWFMYWLRSLPGRDNGLSFRGRPLTNWWVFVGDFEGAMSRRMRLVEQNPGRQGRDGQ